MTSTPAMNEKYLGEDEVAELKKEAWRILGLINGYLRYQRDHISRADDDDVLALLDKELS